LIACAVLLVGSGIIEGYISPRHQFPLWARVTIGIGYWFLMIALLKGWLFLRPALAPFTPVATAATPRTPTTTPSPTDPPP
jgi:hypothetical protein